MSDDRYSRQISLPEIGSTGQAKIAHARVLVLGCGALGSIQAELLARAGVGFIRLVDRDIPEWSNLPRQFLFDENDVRERIPKATACAYKLCAINTGIEIEPHVKDVTPANIEGFLQGIDVVLDGVDNFETRYLINDACVKANIPWVYAGVQGTRVLAMPVLPMVGACLQCVFPEAPVAGSVPTCEISGVINTVPALAATLQVSQVLRILIEGAEQVAKGAKLMMIDPWCSVVQALSIVRNPTCPCCHERKFPFLDSKTISRQALLCGRKSVQVTPAEPMDLTLESLAESLQNLGKVTLRKEVLEFEVEGHRLMIFKDGRTVVHGTPDFSKARSLVAKYLGS